MLTHNRFYGLLLSLSAAAYGLLGFLYFRGGSSSFAVEVCPVNRATGIPCPSCGTARSVLLILDGNLSASIMTNPLGLLAGGLMVILPAWIIFDLLRSDGSLLRNFRMAETYLLQNKWLVVLLVGLILANWIWNIIKGN